MENSTRKVPSSNEILKKLNQDKAINEINKEEKKENIKQLLIAHKIDLKDKKNNYYKKGIKEIFNNENIYFSYRYNNQRIKIGNSEQKYFTSEPIINNAKKNIIRKKNYHTFMKNFSNNQIKNIYSNMKNKMNDSNMSILSKYDYRRQTNSNILKRPSIFFKDREYITDSELRIIFQNIKKNMGKNKGDNKSQNDKNIIINNKSTDNKSVISEINNRINLQGKILSYFETYKSNSISLIKRLKKYSKKEDKNLLMNQIDNYRYKLQKINNISKKLKNYEHYSNKIQWLSSLRNYNNKKKNNTIEKANENTLYTYTTNTNNNFNNTTILDNYINRYHYSFGNNTTLYSDIESNISPLYALILPQNQKNNEIIKKKNTLPIIKGKNLLNYEIEISKQLEGKKKILLKNSYGEDDIKPMILANSKSVEKFKIPRAITNTFNLHFN